LSRFRCILLTIQITRPYNARTAAAAAAVAVSLLRTGRTEQAAGGGRRRVERRVELKQTLTGLYVTR